MNKEFARGLNHCLGNTYDSIDKNRHVDNFLLQGLGLFIINLQCRGKGDICSNLERVCGNRWAWGSKTRRSSTL